MRKNNMNRRDFLKAGGVSTAALALSTTGLFSFSESKALASPSKSKGIVGGYGPLLKDPGEFLIFRVDSNTESFLKKEASCLTDGQSLRNLMVWLLFPALITLQFLSVIMS
ncbi:twin-arginine translocation signal domain-containing protein [Halobacillus andaensis]|uniref:twin-arginine translocation signal domain-containing protein n=1 Tax=Halobacillus andaensis TaxID=1176239 RepID=UPI003D729C8F